MRAPKMKRIQDSIHISIAVRPDKMCMIIDYYTFFTFSLGSVSCDIVEDIDKD